MSKRYDKQNRKNEDYKFSNLQESILRHICTTKNANYNSLGNETKKKRTTIIQSLQPLRNRYYIAAQKENPKNNRSKLIFKPTTKGAYYAAAMLDVDVNKIIKAGLAAEEMNAYDEFIKSIPNYEGRNEVFKHIARLAVKYNIFDKTGKLLVSGNHEKLFNLGLKLGIYAAVTNSDYVPTYVFDAQSSKSLTKISTPEERKEIMKFIAKARDNLDSTFKHLIKQFPD